MRVNLTFHNNNIQQYGKIRIFMLQMPLPWGLGWVTNPLKIPICCPTWGRWGVTFTGASGSLFADDNFFIYNNK